MTTPPLPDLPVPTFLGRATGSDHEVRAWVTTAQETVTALHLALLAATVRAEDAERRLADPTELRSPVGEAQARFQSAADAAATVMNEARAILREAREGLRPNGPEGPSTEPAGASPRPADGRPRVAWGPNGSAASTWAAPAAIAPALVPSALDAATPSPAAGSRSGSGARQMSAPRPGQRGHDPATVLPPRVPSRRSKPGLAGLLGRLHRP